MNPRSSVPAVLNRDLVERFFMDKYGWTPMEISALPYKWIQTYFLIDKSKTAGIDTRNQLDEFNKQNQPISSRGRTRR